MDMIIKLKTCPLMLSFLSHTDDETRKKGNILT